MLRDRATDGEIEGSIRGPRGPINNTVLYTRLLLCGYVIVLLCKKHSALSSEQDHSSP